MKILVDEMPKKVEDCPWSFPTDVPWNKRTMWLCKWKDKEQCYECPVATGGECLYFTPIARQTDLDCIIDAFNAVPEIYPIRTQEVEEIILRNPNRKDD